MKLGPRTTEFLRGIAVLAAVFLGYRLMRLGVDSRGGVGGIAKGDYGQFFFLGSALWKSLTGGWKFYVFLVIGGVVAWRSRKLRSWKELTGDTGAHIVIWAVLGVLTWSASLYCYNFYFGQAHLLDRLLVIVCGLLAFRFPAVLPLFTFILYVSYLQWRIPLGDPEITNRKPFLDLLLATNVLLLLRGWKWLTPSLVAIVLLSINFIHYWVPGIAKFTTGNTALEWLLVDRPSNMMFAGYFVGWNRLWDEGAMTTLYHFLAPLEIPLKIFVLVVELALVLSFLNRRLFLALALGRVLLHTGIWILSGDTFWNWIVLQIAIVVAFWRPRGGHKELFGLVPALLSTAFVLLTARSHQASPLGWMDSRLVERYDVYAITVDNERKQVGPEFFAPYGFIFNQTKWHFLLPENEKTITRTYGAIHDPRVAKRMRGAVTPEDVERIIAEDGVSMTDAGETKDLKSFLKRWFRNHHEQHGVVSRALCAVAPPPHAYAAVPPDADEYDAAEAKKVKRVEIVFRRVFFDGKEYHLMTSMPVFETSVK